MDHVKVAIVALMLFGIYKLCTRPSSAPSLPETWWGPGSTEEPDYAVRPFRISFSDEVVKDLKDRLKNTRPMVGALEGTGWTYGVDGSYVSTVVDFWLHKYDFKEREEHLNQYSQFVTNIQGLDIHYVHAKPKKTTAGKRVLPLLILHGWPGSVVEFYRMIPLLTKPREEYDFVFEVIAPSLPGFGFSTAAVKPGLGTPQIAVVMKNLMTRLGFEKFYIQGGDWGAVIAANLAALFPDHVTGLHSNLCNAPSLKNFAKTLLYGIAPSLLLPEEHQHMMYPMKHKWSRFIEETGYFHIQATKPDTVGVGPSDSPAALAAYILEKFSTGTNPQNRFKSDGGLSEKYSMNDLIDNLMMYWVPNSATTAMRIYAETMSNHTRSLNMDSVQSTAPTVCAQFPHEIVYQPMDFLKDRYPNLLRATVMPRGGHFAAFEEPELLANDIWESIPEMERFEKFVVALVTMTGTIDQHDGRPGLIPDHPGEPIGIEPNQYGQEWTTVQWLSATTSRLRPTSALRRRWTQSNATPTAAHKRYIHDSADDLRSGNADDDLPPLPSQHLNPRDERREHQDASVCLASLSRCMLAVRGLSLLHRQLYGPKTLLSFVQYLPRTVRELKKINS